MGTEAVKFKKGDLVVCVDGGAGYVLSEGQEYVVTGSRDGFLEVEGVNGEHWDWRFERIGPGPEAASTIWWAPITIGLPKDSLSRKEIPIVSGFLDYFPLAVIEMAKLSKKGNDKHNPGQELHDARSKSTDDLDAMLRHLLERGELDADTKLLNDVAMAWRACRHLQKELEKRGGPKARAAK